MITIQYIAGVTDGSLIDVAVRSRKKRMAMSKIAPLHRA